MPISNETRKSLRRLASLAVQESHPPDSASIATSGFREGLVPAHLREDGDAPESALFMHGDEYRAFNETLRLLANESELEHLEPRDVDSSLWDLVCELSLERDTFKDTGKQSARVKAYLQEVAKPHTAFQVAVPIENLTVEAPIDLTGVRIEKWGSHEADGWAIRKGADLTESFIGRTVAIASVKAGNADRAVQRARVRVERALDGLRFGFAASSRVRVSDNEVMFCRSDVHVVVREEDGTRTHGWRLRFQPFETTLSAPLISRTLGYLEPVEHLISNEGLQPRFRKRFSLALHWISTAMRRTDYDEKVVDICTALESLLTQRSDRWKGELIALRAMLLQCALERGFTDTFQLLQLYELRSRIVHGSDSDLCGEGQYTYLFDAATRLIMQAVKLVNANPAVRNFRDFRNILESEEMLNVAIRWFERYAEYGETIVEKAKGLLPA